MQIKKTEFVTFIYYSGLPEYSDFSLEYFSDIQKKMQLGEIESRCNAVWHAIGWCLYSKPTQKHRSFNISLSLIGYNLKSGAKMASTVRITAY